MSTLRTTLKWWLFPGVNLHARLRYRRLPKEFTVASPDRPRRVLDAGCGNGMLAYQAYLRGNSVIGVTFKPEEAQGARQLFNEKLGAPVERLEFRQGNLYNLDFPDGYFDEIICAEVLEHLRRDADVVRSFQRILKPGGVLHVCCPNADHPYNQTFPLDPYERGGHVRPGYTMASYAELLEPAGFRIEKQFGLGGAIRQAFNARIKEVQRRRGAAAGLPLFFASLLALPFESRRSEREQPFSIYVRAIRT